MPASLHVGQAWRTPDARVMQEDEMLIFAAEAEKTVPYSPDAVFSVVADVTRHGDLAGSGEVLAIRLTTDGPVGVGTRFEADENIAVPGRQLRFVSTSQVTAYEPGRRIAWTSQPPPENKPRMRRIEWCYELTPTDGGTRIVHRVEVEPSSALIGLLARAPYRLARGRAVRRGMQRTLENVLLACERPLVG